MKLSKEIRIAIMTIASLLLLYFGFIYMNFGVLLPSSKSYYTVFNRVDGLSKSSPVNLNGVKVGSVADISIMKKTGGILVHFRINNENFEVKKNSIVELYDNSLMGSKALRIILSKEKSENAKEEDTLPSKIAMGLSQVFENQIQPSFDNLENFIFNANSAIVKINVLLSKTNLDNLTTMVFQIKEASKNLNHLSKKLNYTFNSPNGSINKSLKNVEDITTDLNNAHIGQTISHLDKAILELSTILEKVGQGKGTIGKLFEDESLFNNFNETTVTLNQLLKDLKANPHRYTNFSLFKKKDKQAK